MRVLSLFVAGLLSVSAATAATVEPASLGRLADLSERVFVGAVVAQNARHDGARVLTDTVFVVQHALKGPKDNRFVLTQLGGAVDGVAQHVPGLPTFTVGEQVLLFVERADTGALVVAGLAQGKFTVSQDPKTGALVAQRDLEGLHFVNGRNTPDRTFVGTPAGVDRVAVAEVAKLIAGGSTPQVFAPRVIRTRQVSLPTPSAGEVTP